MKNLSNNITESSSLLRKIAAIIATAVLIGFALMFSMLFIAVALSAGVVVWSYLWWKTRNLRKQMRNFHPADEAINGEIIEGEIIEGEVIERDIR